MIRSLIHVSQFSPQSLTHERTFTLRHEITHIQIFPVILEA